FMAERGELDVRSAELGATLDIDLKNKELLGQGNVANLEEKTGLWLIFGLGFLGGFIALFTPCVFPMIPLTVSFFTKQSPTRSQGTCNALLYGLFMVLIYFLMSQPFHFFNSVESQIMNTIATNIWLKVFFSVIFVIFAFFFFGYY